MSAAIAGSEVAITVESMFSMNSAVATISGIRRCLFITTGELGAGGRGRCIIPPSHRLLRNRPNHLNPARRWYAPRRVPDARDDEVRRHREVVAAIRRRGPPPGYWR